MIRIGTRRSRLALIQAELLKKKILEKFPEEEIEIVPVVTTGDREKEKPFQEFAGKGIFTLEIEEMLLRGEIEFAVHSAKDLPMEEKDSLYIAAVLEREDARDVLITRRGENWPEQGAGKVIGTSSLRRELQIKEIYRKVQVKPLRGNVPTRIRRLLDGSYDGIILAAAGLKRLSLDKEAEFSYQFLPVSRFVPAAGQGILAVQADRKRVQGDSHLAEILCSLHDESAYEAFLCERSFLKIVQGGCDAPLAVYAEQQGDRMNLYGMYAGRQKKIRYRFTKKLPMERYILKKAAEEMAEYFIKGRVSIVGAGIGGHDMLTVKALECVRAADVIVYDDLLSPSILNEADEEAELIYVGKRLGHHHETQEKIEAMLIAKAEEGKYVVRLKGGDPFIFGRGGEEALALREKKIECEVVPGVSSAYAVPSYADIPVTHRGVSSSFHVITGHHASSLDDTDYQALAGLEGTLVFLMGMSHLKTIAEQLIANGMPDDTPAAVIMQGGGARQSVVTGSLENIYETVVTNGMKTPAVIIVGHTVTLREQLFKDKALPLSGKRILITATRQTTEKIAEKLLPLGAEPVKLSLIGTRKCTCFYTPEALEKYRWIVFLSSTGIRRFFEDLREHEIDLRRIAGMKFAVIGSATADCLKSYGYHADYIPEHYRIKELAEKWIPMLQTSEKVLLIRGRLSAELEPSGKRKEDLLFQSLKSHQISYDTWILYETYADFRRKEDLNRLLPDMDAVVVCSSSAAGAVHLMASENPWECIEGEKRAGVIAIGPETEHCLKQFGIPVWKTAETYNADGIVEALCAVYGKNGE